MSQYQYLQLQPVEPDDDDSPLDDFAQDDTIDLTQDDDEETLDQAWERVMGNLKTDIDSTSKDDA
jgi:hypothetical protein